MNVNIIVQARTTSSRLPGKVLMEVGNDTMLERVLRVSRSVPRVGATILAVPAGDACNEKIVEITKRLGVVLVSGSESNVFSRYGRAIDSCPADAYVRLTADCPMLDPTLVFAVISTFEAIDVDYMSTGLSPRSIPHGLDIEIFSDSAFKRLSMFKLTEYELEHVTPGFYNNPELFSISRYGIDMKVPEARWCVDELADLKFIRTLYELIGENIHDYLYVDEFLNENRYLLEVNRNVTQRCV